MDILIVDDDHTTGHYLQHIVSKIPGINVLAVADNGHEAIRLAREHNPQVIFLDVDMPEMSGLEVARKLVEWNSEIILIFATAYPDYALEAFEVYPFDYILKPLDEERIKKTLSRLNSRLEALLPGTVGKQKALAIQIHGQTYTLKTDEILYIESCRTNILIKTVSRKFNLKGNLINWEQRLAPFGFVQSHRSYLVNVNQVAQVSRYGYTYDLLLKSGDKVPLSRNCAKQFKKLLGNL